MTTVEKWAKELSEQHVKQAKEPVACPYCDEGRIEYDIVKDEFQCSDCRKVLTGVEYEALANGSPKEPDAP